MTGRFAAWRVRPAHQLSAGREQLAACWLLAEWAAGAVQPAKYFFSNLPAGTSLDRLTATAKSRWWMEHSYRQLKDELGLDHFAGRSWRFHPRHVVLVLMAYAFLQDVRRRRAKSGDRLTLPRVREELQWLLACWCGRCPVYGQAVPALPRTKPP